MAGVGYSFKLRKLKRGSRGIGPRGVAPLASSRNNLPLFRGKAKNRLSVNVSDKRFDLPLTEQQFQMAHLTIDKEFRDLIPPLSDEELSALEISLKAEGCRDALIVWNNTLIDGHNRHTICTANKIPFETTDKEFIDRDDAKLWIIDNQLGRRNLTPFVRTELHLKKKAILAAEARKKVVEVGKQTGALKGKGKGAAGRVLQNSVKPLETSLCSFPVSLEATGSQNGGVFPMS